MIRVYELTTPEQLALLEPELRETLAEMQPEFDKSVDETWNDLAAYYKQLPHAGIWVALDDGRLAAWSAAKMYIELPANITGAVTWAWAAVKAGEGPRMLHELMQEWCRGHGGHSLYAARRTRLDAYARWIARYGYRFDRVVFVCPLTDAGASAEAGGAHELRRSGQFVPVAEGTGLAGSAPSPETGVRRNDPGDAQGEGEPPGYGDLGAAAAGGVKPAKRRSRARVRRRRVNGGTDVGSGGSNGGRRRRGRGQSWNSRRWIRAGVVPPER